MLISDIIHKLLERFHEVDIELILMILKGMYYQVMVTKQANLMHYEYIYNNDSGNNVYFKVDKCCFTTK